MPVAPPPTDPREVLRAAMLGGVRLGPVCWMRAAIIDQLRARLVAVNGVTALGKSAPPLPILKILTPSRSLAGRLTGASTMPSALSNGHPRPGWGQPRLGPPLW